MTASADCIKRGHKLVASRLKPLLDFTARSSQSLFASRSRQPALRWLQSGLLKACGGIVACRLKLLTRGLSLCIETLKVGLSLGISVSVASSRRVSSVVSDSSRKVLSASVASVALASRTSCCASTGCLEACGTLFGLGVEVGLTKLRGLVMAVSCSSPWVFSMVLTHGLGLGARVCCCSPCDCRALSAGYLRSQARSLRHQPRCEDARFLRRPER